MSEPKSQQQKRKKRRIEQWTYLSEQKQSACYFCDFLLYEHKINEEQNIQNKELNV